MMVQRQLSSNFPSKTRVFVFTVCQNILVIGVSRLVKGTKLDWWFQRENIHPYLGGDDPI